VPCRPVRWQGTHKAGVLGSWFLVAILSVFSVVKIAIFFTTEGMAYEGVTNAE